MEAGLCPDEVQDIMHFRRASLAARLVQTWIRHEVETAELGFDFKHDECAEMKNPVSAAQSGNRPAIVKPAASISTAKLRPHRVELRPIDLRLFDTPCYRYAMMNRHCIWAKFISDFCNRF